MGNITDLTAGMTRGVCQVCRTPVDGRSFYCSEHRPARGKAKTATPLEAMSEPATINPVAVGKTATADNYMAAFGDFILTLFNQWFIIRQLEQLPEGILTQEQAEEFIITEGEMFGVLKPAARVFAASPVSKRYGKQILENSDVLIGLQSLFLIQAKLSKLNRLIEEVKAHYEAQQVAAQGGAVQAEAAPGTFQLFDFGSPRP